MNTQENIGDLIVYLNKELKTITERKLKRFELGIGQLQILMLFYKDEGCRLSQSDMVAALGIDKGNVSRNVSKLIRKGYLDYEEAEKQLVLSHRGKGIKKDIIIAFGEINKKMIEGISTDMIELTCESLKRMKENMEA